MALQVTFYGGASAVTGSNFLIEEGDTRVLVDCGIEQGKDFCETCTYDLFPYDPAIINALVITHAHLDHVGRAPALVKAGFRGKVFMTAATRDLSELILRDSVDILAREARAHNLTPLYREADVDALLSLVEPLSYGEEKTITPGFSLVLRRTGHILGSASVRLRGTDGTAVAFTGDVGNAPSPFLPDPEAVPDADALVMESVYGDRLHPGKEERVALFQKHIHEAVERGGSILIPAFSLERTQLMLYELSNLMEARAIPRVAVFLDSPLAISITEVYKRWGQDFFKPAALDEIKREGDIFDFPFLTKTRSSEESSRIAGMPDPKIIIAGAGMSHGGRIQKHELRTLSDPKTTLFLVGYQAPGSPGRLLQDRAPVVSLGGKSVRVRATVVTLLGWSAHADRDGLMAFAEKALPRAKTIFTALGEPSSARFLAQRIHDFLGGHAVVPQKGERWEITQSSVTKLKT